MINHHDTFHDCFIWISIECIGNIQRIDEKNVKWLINIRIQSELVIYLFDLRTIENAYIDWSTSSSDRFS